MHLFLQQEDYCALTFITKPIGLILEKRSMLGNDIVVKKSPCNGIIKNGDILIRLNNKSTINTKIQEIPVRINKAKLPITLVFVSPKTYFSFKKRIEKELGKVFIISTINKERINDELYLKNSSAITIQKVIRRYHSYHKTKHTKVVIRKFIRFAKKYVLQRFIGQYIENKRKQDDERIRVEIIQLKERATAAINIQNTYVIGLKHKIESLNTTGAKKHRMYSELLEKYACIERERNRLAIEAKRSSERVFRLEKKCLDLTQQLQDTKDYYTATIAKAKITQCVSLATAASVTLKDYIKKGITVEKICNKRFPYTCVLSLEGRDIYWDRGTIGSKKKICRSKIKKIISSNNLLKIDTRDKLYVFRLPRTWDVDAIARCLC